MIIAQYLLNRYNYLYLANSTISMSQTHNSHHLQQQHPDIYQRLFASSQIIVSVPLTIKRNPTGIESRDLIASLITATGYKVYA